MAKRQSLIYDSAELTQSLRQSTGQGVNAFFPQPAGNTTPSAAGPAQRHSPRLQAHSRQTGKKPARKPLTPAKRARQTMPSASDPNGRQKKTAAIPAIAPAPPNEGKNEAPVERTNDRTLERTKARHTFDIFKDQLASLRKIQLAREELFGKRYLLGDLVQEALDMLITKERNSE